MGLCESCKAGTAWSARDDGVDILLRQYFGTTLLGLAQLLTYLIAVSLVMGPHAPEYWTEFLRGTVDGMTVEERERRAELAGTWKNWFLIVLFLSLWLVASKRF